MSRRIWETTSTRYLINKHTFYFNCWGMYSDHFYFMPCMKDSEVCQRLYLRAHQEWIIWMMDGQHYRYVPTSSIIKVHTHGRKFCWAIHVIEVWDMRVAYCWVDNRHVISIKSGQ
jgi:hypothetical protein